MPSIKRRIAIAGQNSSVRTGFIKTSLTGSMFLADIPLPPVTMKYFPVDLVQLKRWYTRDCLTGQIYLSCFEPYENPYLLGAFRKAVGRYITNG